MMKPFAFQTQPVHKDQFVPLKENFAEAMYGHVNKGGWRTYYKSIKPDQFATNKNNSYKPLTSAAVVTSYKTEIRVTPTCDFFAEACTNGSETTYWCDYNWDNTDTSEHCLLIGGHSDYGGGAGLFYLSSINGVSHSYADVGSRLTYLPWAE